MFQVASYTMKFGIQGFRVRAEPSRVSTGSSQVPFQLLADVGEARHALYTFLAIFL